MTKAWLKPPVTETAPTGFIVPPAPALAVIVYVFEMNDALIVWLATTFGNVYEYDVSPETPAIDVPSTITLAI